MPDETTESEGWTGAERVIREEIARRGPMTFARLMELALYTPGLGYYAVPGRQIGRNGDFYTSVSVGPVFGFLLAQRFADGWAGADRFECVEAAAHDGRLADDVLTAMKLFHPDVFERMGYRIVENSEVRQDEQRRRLEPWGPKVSWVRDWDAMEKPVRGVVFANELLDAFPIHRFGWDAARRKWFEWGVSVEAGRLAWCRLAFDGGEVSGGRGSWTEALLEALPDGFVVESSPAGIEWWRQAVSRLGQGRILTMDYGYDAGDAIHPARSGGTVRAYYQHRVSDDLLARPGEQDLTGHVDFEAIRRAGEERGAETETLVVQGRWLGEIAVGVFRRGGAAAEWLASRTRQLQTLIHPAHLGQAMKVLVQRVEGKPVR